MPLEVFSAAAFFRYYLPEKNGPSRTLGQKLGRNRRPTQNIKTRRAHPYFCRLRYFSLTNFSANYKTLDFGPRCQENVYMALWFSFLRTFGAKIPFSFFPRALGVRIDSSEMGGGGVRPLSKYMDPPLVESYYNLNIGRTHPVPRQLFHGMAGGGGRWPPAPFSYTPLWKGEVWARMFVGCGAWSYHRCVPLFSPFSMERERLGTPPPPGPVSGPII